MKSGGTIVNSKVQNLPDDATQQAGLAWRSTFTMLSAGLAGSTPHMISASITALTRVLYEFHGTFYTDRQINGLVLLMMQ